MEWVPSWVVSIFLLLFVINTASSEEADVRQSLIGFLQKLSPNEDPQLGWTNSTDPCSGGWTGVACNNRTRRVRSIVLKNLGLDGSIDAGLLCKTSTLVVMSLSGNNLRGVLPPEISNCTQLTHLYLGSNRLSGSLPSTLASLNNLKRLDISDNNFSGELPDLPAISGLVTFLAENNRIGGTIPPFDFANFKQFNISGNVFTGPIPDGGNIFGPSSYAGNRGLCGKPLPNSCPPPPAPSPEGKSKSPSKRAIMYSGYIILGLVFILFVLYKIIKKRKAKGKKKGDGEKTKKKKNKLQEVSSKQSSPSSEYKTGTSRSEYSVGSSPDNPGASTSLIVLKNPTIKELSFEELLKAPAELVARGRFGSLYKVLFENEVTLAVKRIKDYTVSAPEFERRMERIDRLKHPNVLPALAFYCSKQEKLVVYEYQQNGSLFKLIHGTQEGQTFDWTGRLNVASGIAEGLSFMHRELANEGTGHGNLKSSNILMDANMEPCISEYGVINVANLNSPARKPPVDQSPAGALKADVYSYGIILLELLTGKLVHENGFDLPRWVHSVVTEEWTAEVFDKALVADGASEERMVHLLQVALKCIDENPDGRPSMTEVAAMINSIRDDDDRSVVSEL